MQAGRETFLGDEPARLDAAPGAIGRRRSRHERDLLKWKPGAVQADLRRLSPQRRDAYRERFRAHEYEPHKAEHPLRGDAMRRRVEIDLGIRAVKRDNYRNRANLDQRQKMDADVPEIDVEQARFCRLQRSCRPSRLGTIDHDRPTEDLLLPEPPELMRARLWQDEDAIQRELIGVFALLAQNHRRKFAQRTNLPVNMKHLRFQKSRHVLGGHGKRRRKCLGQSEVWDE